MEREAGVGPALLDEATLTALSTRFVAACVLAGLDLPDAQDTSQEIIRWCIFSGQLALAFSMPWANAVIRNFVLRFRRRKGRESAIRKAIQTHVTEGCDPGSAVELDYAARNILAGLRGPDRKVFLRIIRDDLTFAEAADAEAIPPGSRGRVRERRRRIAARVLLNGHRSTYVR